MPSEAPTTQLIIVQRGIEATAGTLVPATHRVPIEPGSVKLGNSIDYIRRRYSGSAATSHSSSPGLVHAGVSWEERGYYDYLAYLLSQVLAPTITGTGASPDKTWVFTPSDTAPDGLKRASLEVGGKDTWPEEEHLAGCVVRSLEITWDKTDDWRLAVEYVGTRSTQAAKTGALALPATMVPIRGLLTKCYIDASTFGSTLAGRAISGAIKIENQISERFGADGNEYPNRLVVLGRQVSATVVAEYDDPGGKAARAAWRNATLQKLRIKNTGPVLGGSFYDAQFDIPGTFETDELGDDDGIVTLEHSLVAEYNSTLTADIVATVVCSGAAIP